MGQAMCGLSVIESPNPIWKKIEIPQCQFDHIHIEPLPPLNGYTHLLTVVDRFSH